MQLTRYWHTSRDAPTTGDFAVVLGVEDSTLRLILDAPIPDRAGDLPATRPRVELTEQGKPLSFLGLTGTGIGGPLRRYVYIIEFDLPSPDADHLYLTVTTDGATVLATYVYAMRFTTG